MQDKAKGLFCFVHINPLILSLGLCVRACSIIGLFRLKYHPFSQNPKFQEPVTLDFLDAELENDIKVEVECSDILKSP